MHDLPGRAAHLSSHVLVKAPEGGLDADSVPWRAGAGTRQEAAAAPTWGADARDNVATQ